MSDIEIMDSNEAQSNENENKTSENVETKVETKVEEEEPCAATTNGDTNDNGQLVGEQLDGEKPTNDVACKSEEAKDQQINSQLVSTYFLVFFILLF